MIQYESVLQYEDFKIYKHLLIFKSHILSFEI